MTKKIFLVILVLLISLSSAYAFGQNATEIPAGKTVNLEFTAFSAIELKLFSNTTLLFNIKEENTWLNNTLRINNITESKVYADLTLFNNTKSQLVIESASEAQVNLTKTSPFILFRPMIFTKDGASYAIMEIRYPFFSSSEKADLNNQGKPKLTILGEETKESNDTLLKVLLIVVIILLVIIALLGPLRKKKE